MLRIPWGNDFALKIPIKKKVIQVSGEVEELPFNLSDAETAKVFVQRTQLVGKSQCFSLDWETDPEDDSAIIAFVTGTSMDVGAYDLIITGLDAGKNFFSKEKVQFKLVGCNEEVDVTPSSYDGWDAYNLDTMIILDARGRDGLSAYQIAVLNGFVGTEEEWLESLKGDTGNGVSRVYLISQVGNVDYYRMMFTDGTYFDYTVTNSSSDLTPEQIQEVVDEVKSTMTVEDIGAASTSQLTAEQTARQQADTTLQNNINAEKTARENADTTLQGNITAEQQRAQAAEQQNASDIDAIEAKIPSAASSSNQLADKAFVNSSIATNTATFKGTYNSLAELQAVTGATNNDYGFVIEYDEQGNEYYDRYKYNGSAWVFEYKIESTPFTAAQWAAIQSGITSGDVEKLAALPTNAQLTALLAAKQDTINDLASIRSGASAGATAYQKPSGGIPKSDLSSAVQTSLGKADTALQSYTETDPVFSASPAAGITAGDITEWDGKADPTIVVYHGTSDTTFALTPNVMHVWGTVSALTLTLATPADSTIVNEYMFQFTSGTTATTLSLPSSVVWDKDKGTLTVESGYIYQVSILNNIALWTRVAA